MYRREIVYLVEMSLQFNLYDENFGIPNSSSTYNTSEASCTKLTFQLLIVFEIQYVVGHGLLLLRNILLYVEVLACKY